MKGQKLLGFLDAYMYVFRTGKEPITQCVCPRDKVWADFQEFQIYSLPLADLF